MATLAFRFRNTDGKLRASWNSEVTGGLPFDAEFVSPNPPVLPPVPGQGIPTLEDPTTLDKLHPLPSRRIVVSLLGLTFKVNGEDWGEYVTSFDFARPMHGETQGTIELRHGRNLSLLDPSTSGKFKAGSSVELSIELPNQNLPLLMGGYIVEPPKFKIESTNVGALSLRIGDLFLLKRQSETGQIEPYCGLLPKTTADAAQIFARVRELPGVFGGEALVENVNPDFVEGAPWDFLAQLYEVLNYDVRSDINGNPIALPRTEFNPSTALVLEDYQVLEADWDAPQSLPFSVVPGFNNFERSLGFRINEVVTEDFSSFNPNDTTPYFISNNTYEVIKTVTLGDTAIQSVTQTWGYIPNLTIIPGDFLPDASTGPCGEFIPPQTISTRLDIIQTRTFRAYFEEHLSGGYVVTSTEETTEGWNTYQNANTDTVLYFGQLAAKRENFEHSGIVNTAICPQYWELIRIATTSSTHSRVTVGPNTEPVFQLTSQQTERWSDSEEVISEGQVKAWKSSKSSQNWDAQNARWVGGSLPDSESLSPPTAQFIREFKVPVSLEVETSYPEFKELFGDRPAKPVQFPQAYTTRDLLVACDRYARETTGMAYAIHLLVDPRIPIRPGAPIIYRRPNSQEVHGLAWSVEFNCTGPHVTQSVVLMRTFTEPAIAAFRNNPDFVPGSISSTEEGCN